MTDSDATAAEAVDDGDAPELPADLDAVREADRKSVV